MGRQETSPETGNDKSGQQQQQQQQQSNHFLIKLPSGKPFENVQIPIRVRAELIHQQTKEGSTVEHRVLQFSANFNINTIIPSLWYIVTERKDVLKSRPTS